MTVSDALTQINALRKSYKKMISNIGFQFSNSELPCSCYEHDRGIIFIVEEGLRRRAYFSCVDLEVLTELAKKLPQGIVLENLYRDEDMLEKHLEHGGMERYATYVRVTTWYHSNPYQIPETGKRRLLESMYDPTCGEYPSLNDIQELDSLSRHVFDPVCDDIFDIEKWRRRIEAKEILVYRENGKIIAFYAWKNEGKKLYSNLSVNLGTANYLYNMERRVFEDAWNNDVRVFYAWFNKKNKNALNRGNNNAKKCIKRKELLFNSIYVKN